MVGCQTVIAGKPAPTGIEFSGAEVGQLAGRHREQAHSYRWIASGLQELGRLSGRHRWQASSHRKAKAAHSTQPLLLTTQHDER